MKMTKTFLTAALGLVGLATPIVAGVVYEGPAEKVGCYKGNGTLVMTKDYGNENSMGKCRTTCVEDDVQGGGKGYAVLGLTGPNYCLCGNKLPNNAYKVSDKYCGSSCPSYNQEVCGDRYGEYVYIWTTGLEKSPREDDVSTTTSATSTKSSSPATSSTSAPAETTSASDKKESGGGGVNKGAVAAGVVVGVLVVLSVGVGAWLLIRKRNRERVEEEYRRSAAAREYAAKPNSDHRLDPGMVQRRDSVGSIADNQDYSRRILKVTNPDG